MASRVAEFEWILRDPEASADLVREAMTSRMPLQLTPGGVHWRFTVWSGKLRAQFNVLSWIDVRLPDRAFLTASGQGLATGVGGLVEQSARVSEATSAAPWSAGTEERQCRTS